MGEEGRPENKVGGTEELRQRFQMRCREMRGGKRRDMGGERTGSGRKKEQQKKHKKGGEEGTKYESMRVGVESTL